MNKTFIINNGYNKKEVEFFTCTASAAHIGEEVPQKALFVRFAEDQNHDEDCVIFLSQLPENEEEAARIIREEACIQDWEVLESVIFPDGTKIKNYV